MWNYRIIKFPDHVGLYETIYNDAGEICAHSKDAEIYADTVEDLGETLKIMLHDYNRHIAEPDKILRGPIKTFGKFIDSDDEIVPFTDITLDEL